MNKSNLRIFIRKTKGKTFYKNIGPHCWDSSLIKDLLSITSGFVITKIA